jgi:HSP20 family protein
MTAMLLPNQSRLWKKGISSSVAFPPIDIFETDDEVIAYCDIPDLNESAGFQIIVQKNETLTISGRVDRKQAAHSAQLARSERFAGPFQRSVELPSPVVSGSVSAVYYNGVLEINMLKLKYLRTQEQEIPIYLREANA